MLAPGADARPPRRAAGTPSRARRAVVVVLLPPLLLLAPALAGCGLGDRLPSVPSYTGAPAATVSVTATPPTTAEALRDARTFALSAASAHVVGMVQRGRVRVRIDLEGDAAGTDQRLRVSAPGAGTAELLTVGAQTWLAGDRAFWTRRLGTAAAARAYAGKYLAVSAAQAATIGPYTVRGLLSDHLSRPDVTALDGVDAPVTSDVVDGREVWVLGSGVAPRLVVAADGSASLVRLTVAGTDPADLVLDRWGRASSFVPPAPADVVTP